MRIPMQTLIEIGCVTVCVLIIVGTFAALVCAIIYNGRQE